MRTRHTMTVSLPPAMAREVEAVRRSEHRTRSELVREALRTYFTVRHAYTPTQPELRAIERGRAAFRRGDSITLDDFRASVDAAGRKARAKKRPARATA
ncbi:MAG: ribbon-helix-helix protein, CopG family [Candidatus Rokubacteria bacterium]|nr:ribbon-helix-helix protein, CopG family [Candidatus Rokubacteria bacterium]MBI3824547.1 ribbon-helix-helix protein, CopG family [Candidatus Rokubacteria bacterium]